MSSVSEEEVRVEAASSYSGANSLQYWHQGAMSVFFGGCLVRGDVVSGDM